MIDISKADNHTPAILDINYSLIPLKKHIQNSIMLGNALGPESAKSCRMRKNSEATAT